MHICGTRGRWVSPAWKPDLYLKTCAYLFRWFNISLILILLMFSSTGNHRGPQWPESKVKTFIFLIHKKWCRLWIDAVYCIIHIWIAIMSHDTNYKSTLYVLSFSEEHKHDLTFYVIPPHWFDTGSWNPSSCKARTYVLYLVNIMAADDLAMQGARASETMILIMLNWINLD